MSFRTVNEDEWDASRKDSREQLPEDGVPLVPQSQSRERDEGGEIRQELALHLAEELIPFLRESASLSSSAPSSSLASPETRGSPRTTPFQFAPRCRIKLGKKTQTEPLFQRGGQRERLANASAP